MSRKNIIKAWKNPAYRNSLSDAERAALPPNPAGAIEISDADLGKFAGARINQSEVGVCKTQDGNCGPFSWVYGCPTNFMACLTVVNCR